MNGGWDRNDVLIDISTIQDRVMSEVLIKLIISVIKPVVNLFIIIRFIHAIYPIYL